MSSDRDFDLVLWGASGFTGCLVAHYLSEHDKIDDIDWAIAGRNRSKLEDVRQKLGPEFAELPILIGDSLDRSSLGEIASQTDVVCSTVGPYAKYGSDLVAACVSTGTDYCDLTGEAHWIRDMIDTHHTRAVENDVRLVHCCGFDSIPSDLGVHLLQSEAISRYGVACDQVRFLVWKISGGVSGGTIASVADTLEEAGEDKDVRRTLADPYGLNPAGERSGPDKTFQQTPRHDDFVDGWTGPFIMATINEKIVRRSNALLDYRYGKDFRYSEASHVGKGVPAAVRAAAMSAGFGAFGAAMSVKPTRKLLQRFLLPEPGDGPTKETIEEGHFTVRLFGRGKSDDGQAFEIACEVGANSDPGYGATATMLGESTLCLACDDPQDGLSGGVLTPATAMGTTLIERLQAAGMTFDVLK